MSTLDASHNSKIKYFKELKNSLPKKKKDLYQKEARLKTLSKISTENLTDEEIKEMSNLNFGISDLKQQIRDIEKNDEELDYLLNAGRLVCQYYENLKVTRQEPKSKTVLDFFTPASSKTPQKREKQNHTEIKNNIMNPFKELSPKIENEITNTTGKHSWDNFVNKEDKFQRGTLYEEYLSIIDPNYVRKTEMDFTHEYFCSDCKEYRLLDQTDAYMVCPECASSVKILINQDKPNFKDTPIEVSYFAYKRLNHFNECLAQFQAKESTEIPQEIYNVILFEMKKERNTNLASLNKRKVREYLKKHGHNKYYEHIPHIINRLNGIPPKTMTPKMEEELRVMFLQIQEPFERHRPPSRKNFLNYNYVLHKLCELRQNGFAEHFPLLKSKDNLDEQDDIWKKICADLRQINLRWRYIPSR